MMKTTVVIVLAVAFGLVIDQGYCWWGGGGGRSSRSRRGRWSVRNGGVTYTFRNGVKVTGYGKVKPKTVGVKVTIPFGRKRDSMAEKELRNEDRIPDIEENMAASDELDPGARRQLSQAGRKQKNCAKCLQVRLFNPKNRYLMKKIVSRYDFVMVAKFLAENKSAATLIAKIKFKVEKVTKSPTKKIYAGETFVMNAKMVSCPCLKSIKPGYYVITGSLDKKRRLVLSNTLLEVY
eukprot:gene20225-22201_t